MKWLKPLAICPLLAAVCFSDGLYAAVKLPKESIQTCLSKTGQPLKCYFDQGVCFEPHPVSGKKDTYTLIPCSGAPLLLTPQQADHITRLRKQQDRMFDDCRQLQKRFASGNLQETAKTAENSLEQDLWTLVQCLEAEADLEYDTEKEQQLYQKIQTLLKLLLKYPKSSAQAHHKLGVLFEHHRNYEQALTHYKQISQRTHPFVLVSLGRTACLVDSAKNKSSSRGLRYYLLAIERNHLEVDLEPTSPSSRTSLNMLLEACGFTHLIPIMAQKKSLLVNGQKDRAKTIAFIRKHL